jgi:hypothetical protein
VRRRRRRRRFGPAENIRMECSVYTNIWRWNVAFQARMSALF